MDRFTTSNKIRDRYKYPAFSKQLGFVPTMGALHLGHLELVRIALAQCDQVVVSIFVNPLQFNQPTDLAAYPIQHEADIALLSTLEGADRLMLYLPNTIEIYPKEPQLALSFKTLDQVLEGLNRPGHFNGVGIVLSKLFLAIQPGIAFFGQKDLQQVAVVKALVHSLGFPISIETISTVRNSDGLALSSRNARISQAGLQCAAVVYKALNSAWAMLLEGQVDNVSIGMAEQSGIHMLESEPGISVEYFQAVNPYTFESPTQIETAHTGQLALCTAIKLEGIRLIDNIVRW
jgi:pantoate--beta-alanine ligase